MQVAQRKKNSSFAGLILSILISSPSYAALNGVSAAATYPTPQGFAYQTLDHSVGGQVEAWVDSPGFLSHIFPQLHFQLSYEPFTLRGTSAATLAALGISTSLGVTMMGAFVGLQAQTGDYGNGFTPFFTVDFGAVFDTMTYSNSSSVNSNTGASVATQLVPGFDLPIAGHLGLLVELPVRIYALKNTLTIWDAVVGIRLKL